MPLPWASSQHRLLRSASAVLDLRNWGGAHHSSLVLVGFTDCSLGTALAVGKFFLFAHVFHAYVGGIGMTEGISMMPTIPNSLSRRPVLLYSSLHRRGRNIKVGDIIVYKNPLFPNDTGCKRVIGMPGDYVAVMTAGRREADVETVDSEGRWASVRQEMIRVPEGHCWVAGDNLDWSRDSRLFGPLPLGLVQAKVLAVVLPFSERKWVGAAEDVIGAKGGERDWVVR